MSQLPLVPCGFFSCLEIAATTPCQKDKRICFFSRYYKTTSFLCLKKAFHLAREYRINFGKVANFITSLFITSTKKKLLAIMMYECIAKRTKYIFIRLSVIIQLDNGPCTGSPQQSRITLSLNSTLILYHHIQPSE